MYPHRRRPVRQERRGDPAMPAITGGIAHGGHRQVRAVGVRQRARRDRVVAELQGPQRVHDVVDGPVGESEQVEDVPAGRPGRLRVAGPRGHRLLQRPRRCPDLQMLAEQDAERLAVVRDRVVGADAELGQDRVDEDGVVGGVHREGIARLIGDSGSSEVHLVVADLLVGFRRGE